MSEIINDLIKNRIEKFDSFMTDFCRSRGIEKSFQQFLTYKSTDKQRASDSYQSLYRVPVDLLVSSKTFKEYYYNLDSDFKADLISEEEYKRQLLILTTQQSTQKIIKSYLQEDCVW